MGEKKPLKKFSVRTLASLGIQRIHRQFQPRWWTLKKKPSQMILKFLLRFSIDKIDDFGRKIHTKIDQKIEHKIGAHLFDKEQLNNVPWFPIRSWVLFEIPNSPPTLLIRIFLFSKRHTIKPCSRNASRWYASIQLDHKWWTFSASYLLVGSIGNYVCVCRHSACRPLFHHCVRTIRTIGELCRPLSVIE